MILFLGKEDFNYTLIHSYLLREDGYLLFTAKPINIEFCLDNNISWIISYNYKYIINKNIIEQYKNHIINLHISYLPYNRGADPNLWSWLDHSPKGVSIHFIDDGIDNGDILCQKMVDFNMSDSLSLEDTYIILHQEIQMLFTENWGQIKNEKISAQKQNESLHTIHRLKDRPKLNHGWKTKIKDLTQINCLDK